MNNIPAPIAHNLPGIDMVFGLKQCLGNQDLFQNLLHKFWEDYGQAAESLHKLNGDREEQNRFLHTLSGVATNLGLIGLSILGRNIRQDLKSCNRVDEDAIEELHKELEKIGGSIKTLDSYFQS